MPEPDSDSDTSSPTESESPRSSAYGAPFWFTYVSAVCVMTTVSLMFRYADFVQFLGGKEVHLGWIVGIGSVGSLLMRLAQGSAVDHYGPRRVWLCALALLVVSMLAHTLITSHDGPAIFIVRVTFATCVAGVFGSSITYLSLRVPIHRMAEVVGVCGTAGFVGMAIGPRIGDWICAAGPVTEDQLNTLFLTAAGFSAVAWIFAYFATLGEVRPQRSSRPSMWKLLMQYRPGPICVVALIMGIGFGLPTAFVRSYAAELGIEKIAVFFTTYAATAFVVRIFTFRWPERIGVPAMVLTGIVFQAANMFAYLAVSNVWMFILPAFLQGVAHAFLFPSIMAGGSAAFPPQYRGFATALMMGMMDLGMLVGSPLIGSIVEYAPAVGLPGYPTMFIAIGTILAS
ncbi:MAG: MFS transporter, partial [Pirellulales bacterium]|nr:MFS transporter [Pirellulales bacterium]